MEYHHFLSMCRFKDSMLDRQITVPDSGKAGSRKFHIPFQLTTNEHLYDMFRHVILMITECKVATRCVMQLTSDTDFSGEPIMFSQKVNLLIYIKDLYRWMLSWILNCCSIIAWYVHIEFRGARIRKIAAKLLPCCDVYSSKRDCSNDRQQHQAELPESSQR
jgi:hypothetical protein